MGISLLSEYILLFQSSELLYTSNWKSEILNFPPSDCIAWATIILEESLLITSPMNVDLVIDGPWEGIPIEDESSNQKVHLKQGKWKQVAFSDLKSLLK